LVLPISISYKICNNKIKNKMSEEVESTNDGTWSGLKKTIIGVATTAVMGLGTWGVTKITGGEDDAAPAPAPAPVININNTQTQSQAVGGGKTVIVKEKTVEKPATAPAPKKKEGDEFKEKPAEW
jgi:hypothetical protein